MQAPSLSPINQSRSILSASLLLDSTPSRAVAPTLPLLDMKNHYYDSWLLQVLLLSLRRTATIPVIGGMARQFSPLYPGHMSFCLQH